MTASTQKSATKATSAVAERRAQRHPAPAAEGNPAFEAIHALHRSAGNRAFTQALGGGTPLDPRTRAEMEARFGVDLGAVRVHDDSRAHDSAALMDAKAYTRGEDIVFNMERFAPHSATGKRLLAHELAHVVQQRRGGAAPALDPHAPHEQAAAQAADAVAAGSGSVAVRGGTGVGVAREEDDDSWSARFRRRMNALKERIPEKYREQLSQAADFVADKAVSTVLMPVVGPLGTGDIGSSLLHAGEKVVTGKGDPVEDLKAIARTKVQESIGAVKGVVTQVTEVADTGLWLGREYKDARNKAAAVLGGKEGSVGNQAVRKLIDTAAFVIPGAQTMPIVADVGEQLQAAGLVDKETGDPSLTAPLSEKLNEAVQWTEKTIGGTPSDPEMFSPAEKAEIASSIGVQVALAFTGAEEVKVAMNVVGALGGLRGVVQTVEHDPNWQTNSRFWGSLIGMVLSIVGLKHSLAASKITTLVLKFGWIAAAIPPMAQMIADYTNTGITEEERERRMKKNWIQVVHVLKDAILHVAQSQGGKSAAPNENPPPPTPKNTGGEVDVTTPPTATATKTGQPATRLNTGETNPPPVPAEGGATPIVRAKPPAQSAASKKLEANLEKLPPDKVGTVTPLRRGKTGGPPTEPAQKDVPVMQEESQKTAVGQTHGAAGGGGNKPSLHAVEANEPTVATGKGGSSKKSGGGTGDEGAPSVGGKGGGAKKAAGAGARSRRGSSVTAPSAKKPPAKASGGKSGGAATGGVGKTPHADEPPSLVSVNSKGGRGTNEEPLVAVRVQGGGAKRKGTYWEEGTPEFERATKNPRFVVMPKTQANALKFRPAGTAYDATIKPYKINGVQVESNGAGGGKANQHNITARAAVQEDEAVANKTFGKTIGATRAEADGYKHLLKSNNELGILRPGNVSTGGVDGITASVEGNKAKIFLNDFTGPETSKGPKPTHRDWVGELDDALKDKSFGFGDAATDKAIRDARVKGEVYVRTVRVEYTPQGTATVTVGEPRKVGGPK